MKNMHQHQSEQTMNRTGGRRLLLLIMAAVLLASLLASCGKKEAVKQVGILQLVQHESLDAAREGFIAALAKAGYEDGKNIKIDYQNASNDQANLKSMAERLVRDSDLVFAITTPAAQTVVNLEPKIPVVFAAVTDPVSAGLVDSLDKPGRAVTGASDMAPIDVQIELLLSLKPMDTIGLLYNAGEPNSVVQVEEAKMLLEAAGKTVVEMSAASTNDVSQVTQNLVAKVDGIYIPTDNTMASTATTIGEITKEAGIPSVCGSVEQVANGGTATVGINYTHNGEIAGEKAVEILKGKDASTIAVSLDSDVTLVVNKENAEAVGVDPDSIVVPAR